MSDQFKIKRKRDQLERVGKVLIWFWLTALVWACYQVAVYQLAHLH